MPTHVNYNNMVICFLLQLKKVKEVSVECQPYLIQLATRQHYRQRYSRTRYIKQTFWSTQRNSRALSAQNALLFFWQQGFGVIFYTLGRLLKNCSVLRKINTLTCFWFQVDGTQLGLSQVFIVTRLKHNQAPLA